MQEELTGDLMTQTLLHSVQESHRDGKSWMYSGGNPKPGDFLWPHLATHTWDTEGCVWVENGRGRVTEEQ